MKIVLGIALAMVASQAFVPTLALARDLHIASVDSDASTISLYDRDTVQGTDIKRAWLYRNLRNGNQDVVLISLVMMDCKEKRARELQGTIYNFDGNSIGSLPPNDWKYMIPGSNGEAELNSVCLLQEAKVGDLDPLGVIANFLKKYPKKK